MILPGQGQVTLRPGYTTTYRVFDARPGGPELSRVDVRVTPGLPLGDPARICAFDASTRSVLPGEPVVLRWECAGSAKVRLEPGGLELDGKSEVIVTPMENTRYTLTANNAAGGQSRTLEVAVLGPSARPAATAAPACTFTASNQVVKRGEQVELRWSCNGQVKVRLDPGGLELDGQSSIAVVPEKTTVYTLSVTNLMGGSSRSLEVRVEEPRRVLSEKDLLPPTAAPAPAPTLGRGLDQLDLPEALAAGEARRAAAPEGAYTLRMVVSGPAGGLKHVARLAGPGNTQVFVIPYALNPRMWVACYGVFPDKDAALAAWQAAPKALREVFKDSFPQRLAAPKPKPKAKAAPKKR
jgi:uncharacterized protein YndB with AHSA1/START domain